MTGTVIRARDAAAIDLIKPFLHKTDLPSKSSALPSTEVSAESPPQRSAVVDLMETLALRDAEISRHAAALDDAFAAGEAAGRAAAEETFEDDRADALKLLGDGIAAANTQLATALEAFESLALAVAVEAIDKLTGNPQHFHVMLTSAIGARVREIEQAAIIAINVSRSDFPDTREVAALAGSLGLAEDRLRVDDECEPGECAIKLSLGTVEFGLGDQWAAMSAMLAGFVRGDAAL